MSLANNAATKCASILTLLVLVCTACGENEDEGGGIPTWVLAAIVIGIVITVMIIEAIIPRDDSDEDQADE